MIAERAMILLVALRTVPGVRIVLPVVLPLPSLRYRVVMAWSKAVTERNVMTATAAIPMRV